jgi:alpha-mannosidase
MEILLREVELAWSMLPLSRYPARSLEQAWKTVLLNQFHDIIPGSSITRVYKEAHEQYRQVEQTLNELLDEADHLWMGTLCNDKRHIDNLDVGKLEKLYAVRNSLSWDRTELVMVPETSRSHGKTSKWMSAGGDPITCQRIQGGTLLQVNAPAFGHNLIGQGPTREISPAGLQVSQKVLQNRLIRVEFAADGNIRRIYDKLENREVLRAGARGNQFCLFEDQPLAYEAWDIDAFYMEVKPEHPRLVSNQILEQGPLRASLVQTWTSEKYDIRQVISLTHDSRLIGFETRVDWRESRHMLRVQFPVDIHASQANYEIQFGHVSRPTHMNTSWDMARFEVVAHKWADISQPNYGVAIINDCKYGHQILGNTISLNLLRSPKIPDAEADMHVHEFRYGLLPHPGDLHHSEVITKAHEFNTPLRVLKAEPGRVKKPVRRSLNSSSPSLIVSNQPNVIIDTVKKAESDNALIVRCFEAYGTDCTCKLEFAAPVKQVHLVNLLESQVEEIELSDNRVELTFNPFEIITLKVS